MSKASLNMLTRTDTGAVLDHGDVLAAGAER
jgi:hypothetical protein